MAPKVGAGKEVKWPVGIGAQGNDGVATGVKQTPGAVGYVELQYATTAKLTSAYLKNADGNFVPGSTDGVTAAAEAAKDTFPEDMRQAPIINGAGPDTYPIASYTYLLVYQDQTNADKGKALVSFLGWALTEGQALKTLLATPRSSRGGPQGDRRRPHDHDGRRAESAVTHLTLAARSRGGSGQLPDSFPAAVAIRGATSSSSSSPSASSSPGIRS